MPAACSRRRRASLRRRTLVGEALEPVVRDGLIRLAASVVIEQNDEWLVGRRYLSAHSLEVVLDRESGDDKDREETRELTAA